MAVVHEKPPRHAAALRYERLAIKKRQQIADLKDKLVDAEAELSALEAAAARSLNGERP
jgi:hypothetical protein